MARYNEPLFNVESMHLWTVSGGQCWLMIVVIQSPIQLLRKLPKVAPRQTHIRLIFLLLMLLFAKAIPCLEIVFSSRHLFP